MVFKENFSIKRINTFGVDAKSNRYIKISKTSDLINVLKSNDLPIRIVGGGSNVLWTKDFNGLTIHIANKGISIIKETSKKVVVEVQSGENWHDFVIWSINNGYGGLENLSLIPGYVGAAPIQNIGAYGVELADVFISCSTIEINTLKQKQFNYSECNLVYRDSIFKNENKGEYIITSIILVLTKNGFHKLNTDYDEIKSIIGKEMPTPKNISDAVIKIRLSKLPNPEKVGNCGSFFKNPIISKSFFKKLKSRYHEIPNYTSKNDVKIPAAWLIDNLNLKGYRVGDAGIDENHALVLVNYGNASGKEILKLANEIITKVKFVYGIKLIPEVNIW